MSNELTLIENGQLTHQAITIITTYESAMAKMKAEYDTFREALLKAMEENGVYSIKGDGLAVTYIAPSQREVFDSKKFRNDNPDLYDAYVKLSPVKSSIRIKADF